VTSKKILAGLILTAAFTSNIPAEAGDVSPGAAAAVGVLGGLAIGGALGSAAASPYYPGKPVYSPPPRPVYYSRPPARVYYEADEGPACYMRRRRYVDEFGDVVIRRTRVCE
jgi:hypothetical protein